MLYCNKSGIPPPPPIWYYVITWYMNSPILMIFDQRQYHLFHVTDSDSWRNKTGTFHIGCHMLNIRSIPLPMVKLQKRQGRRLVWFSVCLNWFELKYVFKCHWFREDFKRWIILRAPVLKVETPKKMKKTVKRTEGRAMWKNKAQRLLPFLVKFRS